MRHLSYLREGRKAAAWRVAAPVLAALLLVIGGDQSPTIPGESFIGAPTGPATPAASPVPPSWEFGTVPNAYSMSLTADAGTGRQPVTASWTYIDGLPGLNAQIDSWLLDILDAKTAPAGGRYRPAMALSTPPGRAPGPGTTLTAQPVQASGTVIVFRETEKDTAPDGTSTLTAGTVYADTGTGEVHRAADLFRPESLSGIRSLAAEAVNHNAGPTPAETTLSDVLLNDDGAIQVSTARPGIKNLESAAVTVTVGATDAGSALSDFGLHVLSQIRSRAPVAAAPASPPGLRHINCDIIPCASLTYDDGPDPKTTPQLLGILKEKNVSATFFMQGTNASANPGTAKQVTDAGHTVGNHTFSHPNLTKLSAAGVRSEIDRAGAAIRAATGTAPTCHAPALRGRQRRRAGGRGHASDPLVGRFAGLAEQEPGRFRAQSAQRNHTRRGRDHARRSRHDHRRPGRTDHNPPDPRVSPGDRSGTLRRNPAHPRADLPLPPRTAVTPRGGAKAASRKRMSPRPEDGGAEPGGARRVFAFACLPEGKVRLMSTAPDAGPCFGPSRTMEQDPALTG